MGWHCGDSRRGDRRGEYGKAVVSRIALAGLILLGAGRSEAASPSERAGPEPARLASIVERGAGYLTEHGQAEDGSFSGFTGSGITALATTALLRSGRTANDPAVARGLEYLEKCVQPEGGIHGERSRLANYETCVAMLCLSEANGDGRYDDILKKAEARVRGLQWDETKGKDESDFSYGGVGYGDKSRPDLSNTSFLLDALKACGAKSDDKAIQKALVFVSRCQNLETEHNTTPFAAKINDGGFYYTCTLSRMDEERQTPDGGLRSYGTMGYAGLKSMIYAGLTEDDPRLNAALGWIRKNYDLKQNPGMGTAGLYYYYHTFAKAMDTFGDDYFEDASGVKHDWRKELTEELASRQQPNGSWVNENRRWFETDPNLVTAYSLLALSYCRPAEKRAEMPPK
ncbi:MAG: terpene cyclase/mutase family protein [Pirellulaceae bacterium]|nr:terpene cyclase/mutase family protein [Pirellulaceae bacterium]